MRPATRALAGLAVWFALQSGAAVCRADETAGAPRPATQKTQLVLKLASDELISVNTKFQEDPPAILIQFPPHRIIGSLPEASTISQGAVQSLETIYAGGPDISRPRWIQEVRIRLRGAYPYEVRSEPGTVIIDVTHPAEVAGETLEVGLTGGVVVSGAAPSAFSARFRAMEEALKRAMPQAPAPAGGPGQAVGAAASSAAAPQAPPSATPPASRRSAAAWVWLAAAVIAAAAWQLPRAAWWRAWTARCSWWPARRSAPTSRVAPEVRIVDQLVWRAFERKGFQLLHMLELERPVGLLRIMVKDGQKSALLCVGEGLFFEKTVVEEFERAMRGVPVKDGFIVAPGSFTVPAQRVAKEYGIALIGREQLIELLSEGAVSEHFSKQLRQLHDQVHHAKITLEEYAKQLEVLRRQRNEASWFLGEERTKSAVLQTQVDELTRQVGEWQAQAKQWQESAELTRKQWEESQWYLGEARAAVTHLEEQVVLLQDAYGQLQAQHEELSAKLHETERQRDEAQWFLGESRASCETLKRETRQLAEQLESTQRSVQDTQRMVEHYRRLTQGQERRKSLRLSRADLQVQVQGLDGATLFEGAPRDLSSTGLGLAMSSRSEASEPLHMRLSIPGCEAPIHVNTKTVWQRSDDGTPTQFSGHAFIELTPEDQDRLQQAIAQLAASPG